MHVFLLLGVGSYANCNGVECGKGCSGFGCAELCGDLSDLNASYGCGAQCSNPCTFCSFSFLFTLPTYFFLLKTHPKVLGTVPGVLTHVQLTIVAAIAWEPLVPNRALGITLGKGAKGCLVSVV